MTKVTLLNVPRGFAKYLDLAHEGQEIVIPKRGKPWARLTPVPPLEKSKAQEARLVESI